MMLPAGRLLPADEACGRLGPPALACSADRAPLADGRRLVADGRAGAAPVLGPADARRAASFLGMNPSSFVAVFDGRQTTSSLPMIWTGAQPSALHRASIIGRRASRSSPRILILINWCASSARSASAMTASLRPESPIITTGSRWCASARSARRAVEFSGGRGRVTRAVAVACGSSGGRAAGVRRLERGEFIEDPAIMTDRILLAP